MTMDRILSIKWKDVLIEGNEVRICDYRENYTGGTHNYIRPPTREAADFLIEKYNELYKKYEYLHAQCQHDKSADLDGFGPHERQDPYKH